MRLREAHVSCLLYQSRPGCLLHHGKRDETCWGDRNAGRPREMRVPPDWGSVGVSPVHVENARERQRMKPGVMFSKVYW